MARSLTVISLLLQSTTHCRYRVYTKFLLTYTAIYRGNRTPYIFELTCFIRKYCQSLEQNSEVHQQNTRRKLDIHVKLQKTEIYKKSEINMGTKVYNNLAKFLKEIDDYKAFKKELKLFLLLQSFYSVEEFVSSQRFTCDMYWTCNYTKYNQSVLCGFICLYTVNTLRTGSFKLFKRLFPGFLTILTL